MSASGVHVTLEQKIGLVEKPHAPEVCCLTRRERLSAPLADEVDREVFGNVTTIFE